VLALLQRKRLPMFMLADRLIRADANTARKGEGRVEEGIESTAFSVEIRNVRLAS
jgi:hypothetical protein